MAAPYSVVIPAYNAARFVRRAVESVLAQTAPAAEIFVVDDCSTDGTAEAARAADPRVVVVRNAVNLGTAGSRNAGIAAAATGLIAQLDADDVWHPGKLARQLALLDRHPDLVAACTDFRSVDPAGVPVGWAGGMLARMRSFGVTPTDIGPAETRLDGPVTEAMIRGLSFFHMSSMVVRRTAYDAAGVFDPAYRGPEDLDMWLRLTRVGRVGFIDEILVTVEARPDSVGHQTVKMGENLTKLYATLPGRMPDLTPAVLAHVREFLRRETAALGWHHRRAGNLATARRYYRQSLGHGFAPKVALGLARSYLPRGLR